MIVGNDISNYQGQINWPVFKDNIDFIIAKATEGVGIIDGWYGNNRQQARNYNKPRGWYAFAHPELNSPEDEANWFLKVCYDIQPEELLFLDYEPIGEYTVVGAANDVEWAKKFLDTVSQALGGYKPLFYSFQSMLTRQDWSSVVNAGYGLWVAAPTNDPNNNNFQTGAWPFAAFQQWGNENVPGVSGVVDADVFFGDVNTFNAYGYKPSTPAPVPAPAPEPDPTPSPVTPTEPPPATPLPEPQPTPAPKPNPDPIPVPTPQPVPNPQPTPVQNLVTRFIDFLKKLFNL